MHIKDDFASGKPISQVPAGWFNAVGRFINNLIPGPHVKMEKHDDGSASVIELEDVMTMGTATSPSAQTGANISVDSSGDTYLDMSAFASVLASLQSTWTRGQTDSSGNKVGTKLTVCTGIKKEGSFYYSHFANLSFDENGMLCKVETAQHSYRV